MGSCAVACGSSSLKAQGEECFASAECAVGLVCDLAAQPSVCLPTATSPPEPDASAPVLDAASAQADAAPGSPDAAPPDAAEPDAALPDADVPDADLPDAEPASM